ncbi:hypothetical protein ACIHEJ_35360 [Streptomyces sp. NPDC052301]|uniref:hypothetical protein n=1 Tax=Streptomyces sp. NPDC052301 TaxID=3365687 RepID=UPI0037CF7604
MADIDTTPQLPAEPEPKPSLVLDLVALVVLLAVCAVLYVIVKDPGFSIIIGAVGGLFGTWRKRRE